MEKLDFDFKAFVDDLLAQPFDLLLSRMLGYAIIAGSLMLKVPQILIILKTKNVKEISNLMYYLEVAVFTIVVAYSHANGFPFNTYGESLFILIQDLLIVFLLHHYSNTHGSFLAFATVYSLVVYSFYNNLVPHSALVQLQTLVIPLSVSSRVPQIISNFRNKSTGSLSFLTFFLNFGGAVARVFTTIKLVSDPIVLAGYVLSAVLNGTIVLQILIYSIFSSQPKTTSAKKVAVKKAQ